MTVRVRVILCFGKFRRCTRSKEMADLLMLAFMAVAFAAATAYCAVL